MRNNTSMTKKTGVENLDAFLKSVRPEADQELECMTVGCMLADCTCAQASTSLLPEYFTDSTHREVFRSIKQLCENHCTVDIMSVQVNLMRRLVDIDHIPIVLAKYLECVSTVDYFDYYINILKQLFLKRQFYDLLCIAPLVFDNSTRMDDYIQMAKETLTPLNRALFDTFDRTFVPHWITNGTTTYQVIKSTTGPGGYVWVDGKAVNEYKLLACGFEIRYKDPGSDD